MDGFDHDAGPGPVVIEVEPSAVRGDSGSDVEHSVSDRLGGRPAELADAADALGPAEQVVGGEAQVHPDLVVDEVVERQVRESAGFGVADHVLCTRPLALLQLERRDVVAGLVGDERGVAPTLDGLVAVRSNELHGRMIVDVDWVPSPGGEAAVAMDAFVELAPHCPGAQGVLYDTALRGVHHQRLMRDLGWLSINKVTAKKAGSNKPRRAEGQRVPKSTFVEQRNTTHADGTTTTVDLYACDGAIGVTQLLGTGEQQFEELRRVRTHRNADKNGKFRWYNDYQLPERLGGGTITVRLHATDGDAKRKFNRTENVRPIPSTDPDFAGLYRRRNDAESINRALDDTLWLRRAHSIGHERQHLNLLTFALGVNSLALHRHRSRTSDPPSPRAAA